MNFDFGDVLTRAWKIAWKHKALWIIGVVYGLSVSMMFPRWFSPFLFPILIQNANMDVSSAASFPIVPVVLVFLFIVPSGMTGNQIDGALFPVAGLWIVVFIPFFAVITGWSMTFTRSAWVLTSLRLRSNFGRQSLPGTVEAPA